jgi:hypothetical protein
MARQPVPGALVLANAGELLLVWEFGGRRRLNVLHFTGTSTRPVNIANVDTTNGAIKSLFATSGLQALTAADYAVHGIEVRDLGSATNPWVVATDQAPVVGTSAEVSLPSQIAAVASLHTDKRGKNYHGRTYIPGASEDDNGLNGTMSVAYQTAVRLFVDGIRVHLASVSWPMAVVSRAYPEDPAAGLPAKPADFANVLNVTVDTVFDTQRRRKV